MLVIVRKLYLFNLLQTSVVSEHLGLEVAENFLFLVQAELIFGRISILTHDVVVKIRCLGTYNCHKVL